MTRNAPTITSPIMTTAELAQYLKISVETLRYWRQNDRGPQFGHVGRHVRYRRDAVDAWLDAEMPVVAS